MQETLDTVTGEHKSADIEIKKNYTLLTICDIIDVSNKLNKNPSVITLV